MNKGRLFIYLDLLSFLSTVFYNFQSIRCSLLWLHLFLNILCFDAAVSRIVFLNFIVRLFIASMYMSKEILTPSFSPVVLVSLRSGLWPRATLDSSSIALCHQGLVIGLCPQQTMAPQGPHPSTGSSAQDMLI